jgi:uncharacterized membrane protein HdeD (DUF308 family)
MKGRNLFLTALLAIAAGIALIIFRNVINSATLVTAGGIFFIATGVINMGLFIGGRDKDGNSRQGFLSHAFGWGASAAAMLLGLAMLIFHERFVGLVNFMFAVLIGVAALYQLFLLIFGSRPVKLPDWLFIAPVLLAGASVFLFIPVATDPVVMLTTGIAFVVFGTATLIESFFIGSANRSALKAAKAEAAKAEAAKEEGKNGATAAEPVALDPGTPENNPDTPSRQP